jgi:hypothetical protein
MGGSSSSKSSSANTSTDNSINLNEGGFVATNGSTLNILDGGAVEDAFEFGTTVANQAFDFGGEVVESNENITEDSIQFAENTLKSVSASNAMTVGTLKELAENLKANETSAEQEVNKLLVYGVITLIILALFVLVIKGRK